MTSRDRPPALHDLDPVDARISALMRSILAASALAIIYVDPTEPTRFVGLTYASLSVYLVWTLGLLLAAFRGGSHLSPRLAPWVDVGSGGFLVALTQGTSSIFFFLFLFAVLVASFSRGLREGLWVTIAATALFVVVGVSFSPEAPEFELGRSLIRPIYLLTLGGMIAYWGGREVAYRRHLRLLAELSAGWNPREGEELQAARGVAAIANFFSAGPCHLVLAMPTDPPTYVSYRGEPRRQEREILPRELPESAALVLLGLPASAAMAFGRFSGARHRDDCQAIANLLETRSFATAAFQERDGTRGRFFATSDRRGFSQSDVAFLSQISDAVARAMENTQLTEALVTTAADHERFRISLDIHDTTVQPYVGLKLGLEALLRRATADNPLREGLGELLAVANATIQDLRGYSDMVREGAPRRGDTFAAALQGLAERFERFYGIEVAIDLEPELHLRPKLTGQVIQMVTEGLNNARKHTNARRAFVRLRSTGEKLALDIGNDASGPPGKMPGFTPRSLSERARLLGGSLAIETNADGYTILAISIPLQTE